MQVTSVQQPVRTEAPAAPAPQRPDPIHPVSVERVAREVRATADNLDTLRSVISARGESSVACAAGYDAFDMARSSLAGTRHAMDTLLHAAFSIPRPSQQ